MAEPVELGPVLVGDQLADPVLLVLDREHIEPRRRLGLEPSLGVDHARRLVDPSLGLGGLGASDQRRRPGLLDVEEPVAIRRAVPLDQGHVTLEAQAADPGDPRRDVQHLEGVGPAESPAVGFDGLDDGRGLRLADRRELSRRSPDRPEAGLLDPGEVIEQFDLGPEGELAEQLLDRAEFLGQGDPSDVVPARLLGDGGPVALEIAEDRPHCLDRREPPHLGRQQDAGRAPGQVERARADQRSSKSLMSNTKSPSSAR